MAKNSYPNDTLQPMQVVDFDLKNGLRVRAILLPQPDQTGSSIASVPLLCAQAGTYSLTPIGLQNPNQSVMEAAKQAWAYAQSEAQRVGTTVESARMQGEEFLEVADLNQITGLSKILKV